MKKKKLLSSAVSLVLVFCMAFLGVMTAAAAGVSDEDIVISEDQLDIVVESIVAEFIDAADGADITVVQSDTADEIDADNDGEVTAGEVSESMSKYIFVPYEDVEEISQQIADSATYTVVVLEDGTSTVYVSVNIEENPQLINFSVFKETVSKLADKQGDYAEDGFSLMSYQHIAGELALHVAVLAMTTAFGKNDEGNDLYERSRIADLNIDESRVPTELIDFIGSIIMDIIFMNFYNIYKLITGKA